MLFTSCGALFELKKPPPKALLFEEKLEKLLAVPNREWDEIHTPERSRASSLWKSFIELPTEIMTQGPPQSHMDDIMWETMKINVRTMGLFYRMSDKVAEQRDRLKDLVEKDIARGEKLLDIERKFGDVKIDAEGLMSELQKSMDVAREGTSAMETLVKRFDEAQAKIKSLEVENAALATQIMNAFEKATFKARYDILKDYKAGLLDEAQINEEIEMFEEDYPK
ncbi:hypothetical protein TIFTF001_046171 [Ficus carica]|uniref:Uncharacterized protein n=1 Tax=Ficus carica TaxID=3494 RepID=A0AA88CSE5_FICCA|nr:hypothetical protein TIFTF001_046171 [Ficus carica]